MAIGVVLDDSSVAVEEEVTEGTYVPEASGASFVEVVADGLEFTPAKELIERNNLTNTVENVKSRTGTRSVSGAIPVEYKANGTAGAAPETNSLYRALLGGRRQLLSQVTSTTAHTSTQINLSDGDAALFAVGDVVLVREAGAFELRPIVSLVTTPGSNSITLDFALANGAPSDGVVLETFTTYFVDSMSAPTLSVTHYIGGELREKNIGMRPTGATLENFATGQLSQVNFGLDGLDFDREDGAPLFTPTFDTATPPVVLSACVFIDGIQRDMNTFQWGIENTLGFITSTCSETGRISSRITDIAVSGSMDPYTDDADADGLFDKFKANDDIRIFGFAFNPSPGSTINPTTGIPSEFEEIVTFNIPQATITEQTVGDQERIATNAITWQAHRNLGNDSIFLGFI